LYKTTFIYYLHNGNNVPYYVGKTVNPKLRYKNKKLLEVIDEVDSKEWKFWEKHYISLFKTWGFQLENKNDGGGGIIQHKIESKEKIRLSKIGHSCYQNPQRGLKISSSQKGLSKKHKGLKLKREHIAKLSEGKFISVNQYDLNGKFIKEWNSLKEAESIYNTNNPKSDNIGACCRGKQQTAYNFKWKFKQNNYEKIDK